jgi:hypothetical protein
MLSHLDRILFPSRCEVIEIIPSQRYVYVIFKNGYSSFLAYRTKNNQRVLFNQQIQKINTVDVIIRNPTDRLVSGINTYIQHTIRDNPHLDIDTIKWFAQNYLYLDRHYQPQFCWILNLARYLNTDATINFLPMEEIGNITAGINSEAVGVDPAPTELAEQISKLQYSEMYQRIDTVIFDCIGKSLTFNELLQHIKNTDSSAYEYVIGYSQQILKPTYGLS